MDINTLSKNPDRLLVQIGFAGAHYGLYMPVLAIAKQLGKSPKTRAPGLMMLGVLNLSMKNADGARQILQMVVDTEEYKLFHEDAKNLLKVVNEVSPAKV